MVMNEQPCKVSSIVGTHRYDSAGGPDEWKSFMEEALEKFGIPVTVVGT